MTEERGFEVIKKAILNLSFHHEEHINTRGEGNRRRLMGKHETANNDGFLGCCQSRLLILCGRDTENQEKGTITVTILLELVLTPRGGVNR
ncbi:hypothetical protein BT93_B0858 [Corymbia citriodora subsp. variegata]|nr:hypothetical protein BT93_B0858 [Corymbia citriodora subsp. variegata]